MNSQLERNDKKTPPSELIEYVADRLSIYIGKGIEFDSVLQNTDPNLRINNLDDLLDIHFILSGRVLKPKTESRPPDVVDIGVKDFLSLLVPRLRRLRTTTQRQTREFNGEIRGRIDWQETIKTRYRSGALNELRYSCQLAEETVSIPENLVLWELLNAIQGAHKEANDIIENQDKVKWFNDWSEDSRILRNLETGLKNIHLLELKNDRGPGIPVTNRMIRNVQQSRKNLYAESAELLEWHRKLSNHEIHRSEASEILKRRLFHPEPGEKFGEDDTPMLFELFWILQFLEQFDAAKRNLVTSGTKQIAAWKQANSQFELYHDWAGGDEFAFGEPYSDREENFEIKGSHKYLARTAHLLDIQESQTKKVFGKKIPSDKSRSPDFVFIKRDHGKISCIGIGEVKYTRNQKTAAKGLAELYRYLIFARQLTQIEPRYFTHKSNHFETPSVYGFLCVDKLNIEQQPSGNVQIFQVDENIELPYEFIE